MTQTQLLTVIAVSTAISASARLVPLARALRNSWGSETK
jgi:hypothetical protein